jgi:hypothetical protein
MSELSTVQNLLRKNTVNRAITNLNSKAFFLPLNVDALSVSLKGKLKPGISVERVAQDIEKYAVSKTKRRIDSRYGKLYYGAIKLDTSNLYQYVPALVYSRNKLIGVLASSANSYQSIRNYLFKDFLNIQIASYLKDSTSGFDLGYTDIDFNNKSIGTSPTSIQIEQSAKTVGAYLNSAQSNLTLEQIKVLQEVQDAVSSYEDFTVNTEYSTQIGGQLTASFKKGLVSVGANIVIIQEGGENAAWTKTAAEKISKDLTGILADIHFSRSMQEEIAHQVLAPFKNLKVTNSVGVIKIPTIKDTIQGKLDVIIDKASPLYRSVVNRASTYNLVNLQSLLQAHLVNVVAANMGNGNRKDILNYRTGRFATSVQVKRLSLSREGMITAFYTYMKNPYATFSGGGAQQFPRSRDPKLLIARSIREVAGEVVKNRLKAVPI